MVNQTYSKTILIGTVDFNENEYKGQRINYEVNIRELYIPRGKV